MNLIEYKYLPKKLNDIIIPNKEEIIKTVYSQIKLKNLNLLIIGSHYTLKSNLITLIVNEYYNNLNIYNYNEYILNIDCFNDINLSNEINDIKTFCKTIKNYKKFLIIDNFDIITETNQQYIKHLIDNNVDTYFIFGCENTNKVNEIIQTRMVPIMINEFGYEEYNKLIDNIMVNENIYINKEDLLKYQNLTPYIIFNLFNKFKLLKISKIDNVLEHIHIIDNKVFDKYTNYIMQDNVKLATDVLFNLYDKGMSLLDIYSFLYEYYKTLTKSYKYKFIEQICKYIKYIYDGYDNKIMLLFYSNDIINIYKQYIV
jgi:hypothetical protein